MDHESGENRMIDERLTLPPILSLNSNLEVGSWPPPSNMLPSVLSPSIASTGSNMDTSSSILSSPLLRRNTHLQDQWSPLRNEELPRTDYFSTSSPPSSYQRLSHTASPYPNYQHHNRQYSAPQLSLDDNASFNDRQNKFTLAPIGTSERARENDSPIEMVLSLHSLSTPTLRNIEYDIDQVIRHCHSLSDNMQEQKQIILKDETYFSQPTTTNHWLEDMIKKSNEILNALLRLRKYQLAAEHARIHRQHNIETQNNSDGWPISKSSTTSNNNTITLNTNRTRKRGKRPVFQGRCHSCNISETPEWRRGPDGARTLCNACGLHYAKLNKKKNKEEVKKEPSERDDDDDTSMK